MPDENAISLLVEYRNEIDRLKAENAALVKERDELRQDFKNLKCPDCFEAQSHHSCPAAVKGWRDRLEADNARLLKRMRQIHARLDYEDKSAVPKDAILAAQGFCEMEIAADDAMTAGKS